jgi:hypothetical protein
MELPIVENYSISLFDSGLSSKTVVTKAIAFLHSNLSLNQTTLAMQLRNGIALANLNEEMCIARHHDTLVFFYYCFIVKLFIIFRLFCINNFELTFDRR